MKILKYFAKKKVSLISILCFSINLLGAETPKPKILVGIVVDQMREDFLFRFYNQYSEEGFKKLMNEGFTCRNMHFNYTPTITAVGHTSIYAGTTPKYHGIIGNSWYLRENKTTVYCVEDSTEQLVGAKGPGCSPRRLLSSNFADELKICTNEHAKVISISLKDRAAILSSGHMPDEVYWFDYESGNFITSTYYMNDLPDWIKGFNQQKKAEFYQNQVWDYLLPIETYNRSIADDNLYEEIYEGTERPVMPYNLSKLSVKGYPKYEVLNRSPFGNNILCDLAIEAIQNTSIGKNDGFTDLLLISFSSTDAAGHTFGPLSKEMNDIYVRLDREIARLIKALEDQYGKGNFTIMLTADHGVGEVPDYLINHQVPAGELNSQDLLNKANSFLNKKLGPGQWIVAMRNDQFYLNHDLIDQNGLDLEKVQDMLAFFINKQEGIFETYTASQLIKNEYSHFFAAKMQAGFNFKLSGDVKYIMNPGWYSELNTCATHNSAFVYDSHVPLIFYGWGINSGVSMKPYVIPDIAPTLSTLLRIKFPSATTGNPIEEALKK